MKTFCKLLLAFLVLSALWLSGCEKTPESAPEIVTDAYDDYLKVKNLADSAALVHENIGEEERAAIILRISQYKSIKEAYFTDSSLVLDFNNWCTIVWPFYFSDPSIDISLPEDEDLDQDTELWEETIKDLSEDEMAALSSSALKRSVPVPTTRVFETTDDPNIPWKKPVLFARIAYYYPFISHQNRLQSQFENSGYYTAQVSESYDENEEDTPSAVVKPNFDFFRTCFKNYGVAFIAAHGGMLFGEFGMQTGERVGTLHFGSGVVARDHGILFKTIDADFINRHYRVKDIPNSIIYLSVCHGSAFAQPLIDKGAGVVISWSNTVSAELCDGVGAKLYEHLLKGKTVKEAIAAVPIWDRYTIRNPGCLVVTGNENMRLFRNPSIMTGTATNITYGSTDISCTVLDRGFPDDYYAGVQISRSEDFTGDRKIYLNFKGIYGNGEFTKNITGLEGKTKYFARAVIFDSRKRPHFGSIINFTTDEETKISCSVSLISNSTVFAPAYQDPPPFCLAFANSRTDCSFTLYNRGYEGSRGSNRFGVSTQDGRIVFMVEVVRQDGGLAGEGLSYSVVENERAYIYTWEREYINEQPPGIRAGTFWYLDAEYKINVWYHTHPYAPWVGENVSGSPISVYVINQVPVI